MDFETEWGLVAEAVLRYCRRRISDHHLAEDVYQATALRACRGHASFRRKCSFLTWVLRIASNEVADAFAQRARGQVVPLDQVAEPSVEAPASVERHAEWIRQAIQDASKRGLLSEDEADVLRTQLEHPDATWDELGAALGVTANHGAVRSHRARRKFRQYLLLHRPELFGGFGPIREASERAQHAKAAEQLSEEEAQVFRAVVFEKRTDQLPTTWRSLLLSACGKVAIFLDCP